MTSPSINRRDFLTYSGAAVAGVTLGEVGRRWLARADERANAWHAPAVETFATSVCRECPAACGVRVRLLDRVPVKLEGNPLCPVSRGRLCAKGQAGIEAYFDPDRLVGPARRVGPRQDGRFEPIAWADAIQVLATQIDKTRGAGRGVVAFSADEHGPFAEAWGQFWTGLGARVAWTGPADNSRLAPRLGMLAGAGGEPVFDVERATYILSFGAPLVEDWLSPVWTQRSYGRFRRGSARSRGRLVHVEGRRSLTARKSDEWLPVPDDRQASLAYGIASVLFREDRISRSLLAGIGGNLGDFEREVVGRYTPDNVAVTTGVPVETLFRLARELVDTPQPLVIVAADAPPDLIDSVLALNAIIGAFDRPGGVFQSTAARTSGPARVSTASELSRLVNGGDAPGVVALRDAAALRAVSAPGDIASVLDRCDFVVSFSPYLDEAASAADLLLPTHTSLESWHALLPPKKDATEEVACARPAAEARLDTRGIVELLRDAATKLGDGTVAEFPWETDADVVKAELDRLWSLRRGTSYANVFQTEWVDQLERGGWWVPPAPTREEFGEAVLGAGGWVDPFVAPGEMRQRLALRGGLTFLPPAAAIDVSAEAAPPPGEAGVRLVVFTPAMVNLMGSPNQPVLFELLGQPESSPWRVWAEVSPETAQQAGLEHGSTVRITSAAGAIDAMAIIVERMAPDTIAVAYVPAIPRGGRWAHLLAADVRRLRGSGDPAGPVSVRLERV
jgi:anaerobic selenocysteine-containing dehydrogenase